MSERAWMSENCDRCTKEDEYNEVCCPVLSALLLHEYPIEGLILHDDKLWPAELECTYFTPRDSDA
ncbi:MAG: hypothetical protein R2749_29675 [Acidimicrobiales bacterium]